MFTFAKVVLLTVMLADSPQPLPSLQSVQPEQLPSINTAAAANMAPVAERSISATCYLGHPKERNSLGSMVVFTPEEAGTGCNSMFYECKGRCFGCYSDFDYSQDVCVDSTGKKFLR